MIKTYHLRSIIKISPLYCLIRKFLIMKKINLFFIVMLFCISANSQIDVKVGLTGDFSFGTMSHYYYGGPGVDINVKYIIENRLGIGISTGFQYFFNKKWENEYDDINFEIVPIRASINYYLLTDWIKPYVGCELGLNFTDLNYSFEYYDAYEGYSYPEHSDYSHTRFGIAPVAGFQIDFGSALALDLNAKLNLISEVSSTAAYESATYLGFNFGLVYRFRWNK